MKSYIEYLVKFICPFCLTFRFKIMNELNFFKEQPNVPNMNKKKEKEV